MQTLVALDLETTGLDPERDGIIEIGAVRFTGERVEDQFQTLINPGRPLPAFITQLTGITDDMLAGAPRLTQVLSELESFVGDHTVLGHSVNFDLGFLQQKGLFHYNQAIDTYDLAAVMLPTAARYDLSSLASALGVPLRDSHRAFDDAEATMGVFQQLFARALDLPRNVVEEVCRLGADIHWGAGWIFEEVLAAQKRLGLSDGGEPVWEPAASFDGPEIEYAPLEPYAEPVALDVEEIAAVLEPGGLFAQSFPGYENRPQQVSMLRAVTEAISSSRHLLVEAGTGIGKSMAYLLPAFEWARLNGQRVVVSTNTINLQDQLIYKDVPDLQAALGVDLRAAVLKGRGNYLCLRRLAALRRLGPRSADEMRVLAKVLVWLASGGQGDRGEISLRGTGEAIAWSRISSDSEDCSTETCLHGPGPICPYYRSRLAAESAHVVIVNHALLMADIATGNRVLPEFDYLIVDEAHHLESATTNGLGFKVGEMEIQRLLRDLGRPDSGLLGQIRGLASSQLSRSSEAQVIRAVEMIGDQAGECAEYVRALFAALTDFLALRREDRSLGPYGQQERIVAGSRTLPEWSDLEIAWDNLRRPFAVMLQSLGELSEGLLELSEQGLNAAEDIAVGARAIHRGLAEVFAQLDHMVFEPDPMMIYWAEAFRDPSRPTLHAAPLEVGPLVERYLWYGKESVIMTSATLTTAGEFDYIRRRLHAYEADELALGSPFDYESSTLLYLVNDIPEPAAGSPYQQGVERGLIDLCLATGGRALALFTSYAQLRRTANAISGPLAQAGIAVLEQGDGASRHALLETFRTSDQAILLGTRSFWEGIDVPGEALSALAIIRIPFDVPSDPIVAARAETYESPFQQYSVPEAILRFRQGFGRLIRTASDRGIVISFDRRLLSKTYGRAFLESLPRCTVRSGRLAGLAEAAERWLGV